jgi:hypothetical protein
MPAVGAEAVRRRDSTSIPGPQTGNGAYGRVPGQISLPPNIYSQLSGALPNFAGLTSGASDIIGSEQSGTLSQNTMNALKNAAAQFGVSSGMGPGQRVRAE